MLDLAGGADARLALDEVGPVTQPFGAQAVKLVGVRGILAPDHEGGVERLGQRAGQRVLVDLGRVAKGVVAAAPADAAGGALAGRARTTAGRRPAGRR